MERLDFPGYLERIKNAESRRALREVFAEIDRTSEQLDSALIQARHEFFEGRWTPDYLKVGA